MELGLDALKAALLEATGHHPFAAGAPASRLADLDRHFATVPVEVRQYFGTHDGASPTARVLSPWMIGPWLPLDVSRAVEEANRRADLWVADSGEPIRPTGVHDWLPLFRTGNGVLLALSCAAGDRHPPQLMRIHRALPTPLPSHGLADLFGFFTEALACGAWEWDGSRGRWRVVHGRLPHHPLGTLL